jgi:O-antigen/teichoic acid export membrane protein
MSIYTRIISIEAVQRQSIISFITQITFTFLGFLSTIYFAHTVGASVLGAYFLFMAYYGISSIISDGGFGGAAIKRISEGEDQDAYFSAFFVLRLLFVTAVVAMLLAFRSYFVDLDNAGLFILFLLALIVSIFHGTIHHSIAGSGKMGIFSTCTFINDVSRIAFQVAAVYFGFKAAGLVGGFVAGMLVAIVIELRFIDLHFVRFGWKHIKSLSIFSFWLFLTSGGYMVFTYSDTVLIGYFLNNAEVGVYRVMFQFATLAAFATIAIRTTLWPKVSRWGKINEYRLIEGSISRAFSYSLSLAIPVLIGGVLLGDKLLYYFYGAEFTYGYPVLVALLCMQVVNVFQYFFTAYLSALDHQKEAFKVTAVSATANIVLNIALIPLIGITGAAIATLATMTLNTLLAWRVLSRIITIKLEQNTILNIIKASVAMGILVGGYRFVVPLSNVWVTLVPIIVGCVVYAILMLKLDANICNELRSIMEKMGIGWPVWL